MTMAGGRRAWCNHCGCEQPAIAPVTPAVTTCLVCGRKTDHYHGTGMTRYEAEQPAGRRARSRGRWLRDR